MFNLAANWPDVLAATKAVLSGKETHYVSSASGVPFETWMVPLHDGMGEVMGVVGVSVDTSQRLQAERANALSEQVQSLQHLNNMKTNMMTMLSHEFRTPLTVIQSSTQIMQKYSGKLPPEKIDDRLHGIIRQVKRLTGLLSQFEEAIEMQVHPPEPVYIRISGDDLLSPLVERMLTETDQRSPITLTFDEALPLLHTDPMLLQRAVENLLDNALKYSTPGEPIRLHVGAVDDMVQIICENQGIGIEEDDVPHVFEPLFRGANVGAIGGAGLGLHTVLNYVTALGGSIEVDSVPGQGSRFIITLPQ